jgi:hypothetical protein
VNEAADPLTLPVTLPVRLPVTLPINEAVIIFAEKLPDASLFTRVDAVFIDVAALANNSAECMLAAVEPPTVSTVMTPASVMDTSPEID